MLQHCRFFKGGSLSFQSWINIFTCEVYLGGSMSLLSRISYTVTQGNPPTKTQEPITGHSGGYILNRKLYRQLFLASNIKRCDRDAEVEYSREGFNPVK